MPILRDLTISVPLEFPNDRAFNLSTNCVGSLFLHTLGRLDNASLKKIIVELCERASPRIDRMIDVCLAQEQYDFERHYRSSIVDRKRMLLDALFRGLLRVCDEYELSKSRFVETYQVLKDGDLQFHCELRKPISSPNRRRKAQLGYTHEMDFAAVWARVWEKGREDTVAEHEFVRTDPHELRFVPMLGKLRWLDNETLQLTPRDHRRKEIVKPV